MKEVIHNINKQTYIIFINLELNGGIGIVEMLKRSNILALVGGGTYPMFSKNKIIIYDDHAGLIVRQIRFNSEVIAVKIRTDCVIGIIEDKIIILNINTLDTIDIIVIDKINNNIYGISDSVNRLYLSFPEYKSKGKVQIEKYFISSKFTKKEEKRIINAHDSDLSFTILNNEGTLLVTASEKGSHIKIFNVSTGDFLAEFKKEKKCKISSLVFDNCSDVLGYSTESGKIFVFNISDLKKVININHIYNDKNNDNNKKDANKKNEKNQIRIKIKLKEKPISTFNIEEGRNIIGFVEPKSFVILDSKGKFYKLSYHFKFGKKSLLLEESFIKIDDK